MTLFDSLKQIRRAGAFLIGALALEKRRENTRNSAKEAIAAAEAIFRVSVFSGEGGAFSGRGQSALRELFSVKPATGAAAGLLGASGQRGATAAMHPAAFAPLLFSGAAAGESIERQRLKRAEAIKAQTDMRPAAQSGLSALPSAAAALLMRRQFESADGAVLSGIRTDGANLLAAPPVSLLSPGLKKDGGGGGAEREVLLTQNITINESGTKKTDYDGLFRELERRLRTEISASADGYYKT